MLNPSGPTGQLPYKAEQSYKGKRTKLMIKEKATYYLFSTALAACLTAFPACSADEAAVQEPAPAPPAYDGQTVKTQFAIHVPHADANKRMTEANTQNDNRFLGMHAIRLIPLDTPYNDVGNAADRTFIDYMIRLEDIEDFNTDDESGYDDTGKEGVKIYQDVSIPVGTQSFLFYGEAKRGTDATEFTQGALEPSWNDGGIRAVSDITFRLKGILDNTDIETPKKTLLNQLNAVMSVNDWSDQRSEPASGSNAPSTEENTLAILYTNMQKMQAGSAEAIRITLEDLYHTVASIANATTDSPQKDIANAIRTAITNQVSGNAAALFTVSTGGNTLEWTDGTDPAISSFPTAQNLPEGAVQLRWIPAEEGTAGHFEYVPEASGTTSGDGITVGTTDKVKLNSLTYPAALAYHVCSAAMANDDPSASFPTAGSWSSADWADDWKDNVLATSRLVALQHTIQYGVAQLATTVKFASGNIPDQNGTQVVVDNRRFSLTGILVGGQPAEVGYDFLPTAIEPTNFDRTVYDHDIEPGNAFGGAVYVTTTSTPVNYTLLLDNEQDESYNPHQTVNFAIELKNHGEDFRGVDGNLIAKGMTFYLVGKLEPNAFQPDSNRDEEVDHIFVRDHTTTANVTIHSLANAYLTVPDLRATNLQLALSVDLQWQQGYTQDVTLP